MCYKKLFDVLIQKHAMVSNLQPKDMQRSLTFEYARSIKTDLRNSIFEHCMLDHFTL